MGDEPITIDKIALSLVFSLFEELVQAYRNSLTNAGNRMLEHPKLFLYRINTLGK